jgi:16S rRNA (adenine1518-N6/adenine1519-N6)-dimethyltransferase
MVLLVQKEVAERVVALDGKESILSISVKAYGKPKMVMKVPARYFSPSPKVDSAVIVISDISRKIFTENGVSEGRFWEIVKKGFAHKRKKLSGNLKNVVSDEVLSNFKDKRAENLTLFDWVTLARE